MSDKAAVYRSLVSVIKQIGVLEERNLVPTRIYGESDNRFLTLSSCLCGAPAVVEKSDTQHYTSHCTGCSTAAAPSTTALEAAIAWNLSPNTNRADYRSSPWFGIVHLTPAAAWYRLRLIEADLNLRVQRVRLELELGQQATWAHYRKLRNYWLLCRYLIEVIQLPQPPLHSKSLTHPREATTK
ncbi:hypothetical protein [uncultured Umboniibacter sp.]|uniref:hypothetical protein n=1 Tax=uncultured Umboniibacter sp. TaxID=1798917 RepID=UPI0026185A48|nr:hypothetical protein [uncultured Umboniibacter sp.]